MPSPKDVPKEYAQLVQPFLIKLRCRRGYWWIRVQYEQARFVLPITVVEELRDNAVYQEGEDLSPRYGDCQPCGGPTRAHCVQQVFLTPIECLGHPILFLSMEKQGTRGLDD